MSAGTPVRGSPPLFHTLVPEQIRDALRRHLCNLWRCRVPVSASKSRGIFLTCNSPGTGGVHWRLLACPIAFRDDKAVRFRLFFHRFFTASLRSLFCGPHFRLDRWKLFLLSFHDCRNLFPARFPSPVHVLSSVPLSPDRTSLPHPAGLSPCGGVPSRNISRQAVPLNRNLSMNR